MTDDNNLLSDALTALANLRDAYVELGDRMAEKGLIRKVGYLDLPHMEASKVLKRAGALPADLEPEPDALLAWNVGQEDPHDRYPWTWTPYLDANGGPDLGAIHTPNGRRPDGSMHTYWGIVHKVWKPDGILICQLVNQWAHDTFGTPVLDVDKPDPERCPTCGSDDPAARALKADRDGEDA